MTQFAVLTGPKPIFGEYEAVPLAMEAVSQYVGSSLSDYERENSWVLTSPDEEVMDGMCCDAMIPAQTSESIVGTELHDFLISYLPTCTAITLFYATESDDLAQFSDPELFVEHITDSLSGKLSHSGEVYAKYTAAS